MMTTENASVSTSRAHDALGLWRIEGKVPIVFASKRRASIMDPVRLPEPTPQARRDVSSQGYTSVSDTILFVTEEEHAEIKRLCKLLHEAQKELKALARNRRSSPQHIKGVQEEKDSHETAIHKIVDPAPRYIPTIYMDLDPQPEDEKGQPRTTAEIYRASQSLARKAAGVFPVACRHAVTGSIKLGVHLEFDIGLSAHPLGHLATNLFLHDALAHSLIAPDDLLSWHKKPNPPAATRLAVLDDTLHANGGRGHPVLIAGPRVERGGKTAGWKSYLPESVWDISQEEAEQYRIGKKKYYVSVTENLDASLMPKFFALVEQAKAKAAEPPKNNTSYPNNPSAPPLPASYGPSPWELLPLSWYQNEFGGQSCGSYLKGILCSQCNRSTGYLYPAQPGKVAYITCSHKNSCGASTNTLELLAAKRVCTKKAALNYAREAAGLPQLVITALPDVYHHNNKDHVYGDQEEQRRKERKERYAHRKSKYQGFTNLLTRDQLSGEDLKTYIRKNRQWLALSVCNTMWHRDECDDHSVPRSNYRPATRCGNPRCYKCYGFERDLFQFTIGRTPPATDDALPDRDKSAKYAWPDRVAIGLVPIPNLIRPEGPVFDMAKADSVSSEFTHQVLTLKQNDVCRACGKCAGLTKKAKTEAAGSCAEYKAIRTGLRYTLTKEGWFVVTKEENAQYLEAAGVIPTKQSGYITARAPAVEEYGDAHMAVAALFSDEVEAADIEGDEEYFERFRERWYGPTVFSKKFTRATAGALHSGTSDTEIKVALKMRREKEEPFICACDCHSRTHVRVKNIATGREYVIPPHEIGPHGVQQHQFAKLLTPIHACDLLPWDEIREPT